MMSVRFTRVLTAIATICIMPEIAVSHEPSSGDHPTPLDVSGIYLLLDAMDAIEESAGDTSEVQSRLWEYIAARDRIRGEALLDSITDERESDPEVVRRLDALYDSPTYQLYFRQYGNVTPERHRRILCTSFYIKIGSPGGISGSLNELYQHRDVMRSWTDELANAADLNRCKSRAMEWLPPGEYALPPVYLFYDGNGDAYARDGKIGFDVHSLLSSRPAATRFDDLAGMGADRLEATLSHELHHIFAATIRERREYDPNDYVHRLPDQLARRIVSEGVAMRCNVGPGLYRDIKEDRVVIAHWIGEVNEKMAQLSDSTLSEEEWDAWMGGTYQDAARAVLRDYFVRTRPGEDAEALAWAHVTDRPSLVYTLGWWMISRILEQPDGREQVIQLVSRPEDVFAVYNASVAGRYDNLLIDLP